MKITINLVVQREEMQYTVSTGRFPLEEPTIDVGFLVEDVPTEDAEQDKVSMDSKYSTPPQRNSGRKRKPPAQHLNSYKNKNKKVMLHYIMTQYSLKKVQKKQPINGA